MEKRPDYIVDIQPLESTDRKVPKSYNASARSMAESVKKHKRHDKSKKHKKHKKKSKKCRKTKHSSRSSSPNDYVELKLKKDKLEEAKSGMPVTLDVVMETIVTTANEKSELLHDNKYDKNKKKRNNKTTDDISVHIPEKESCVKGLHNGKIVIKDLKDSQLYYELINGIEEKERLTAAEKFNDCELSCSSIDLNKKKKKEKHKSKKKKLSRSKSRSDTPKRHKKRRRSHSPSSKDRHSRHDDFKSRLSNSRIQINSKSRNKDNSSKSKAKSRRLKKSITPDKSTKLNRRSRSRETKKRKRSKDYDKIRKRSRSRETSSNRIRHRIRTSSCDKIDKKKLFKIARKNALSLVQQGVLPVGSVKKDTLAANLPTKTVDELTDFCRKLSKKDKGHDDDTSISSDDEEFKQPFHHPFLVKDRPNIVMNIRNATQLPTKSFQEKTIGQDILRQQFPVSSGQTHSLALNEWVPLGPEESAKLNKISLPDDNNKLATKSYSQQAILKVAAVEPIVKPVSSPIIAVVPMDFKQASPIDDSPTVTNPYAHGSYSLLSYETGQFTGHTGAKILTPAELSAGYQPWVKKDQLKNTAPVNSGIGIHLLQKMGWKPGEGLGKNQSGSLEPLLLDVKMDKRGLVAEEELVQGNRTKKFSKKVISPVLSLDGKHPVSLLNEFCAKRKWEVPKFNTLDESGPSHKKTFIMTVIVNGVQYCSSRCQTKKLAKMEAAKTCLKEIGLLN